MVNLDAVIVGSGPNGMAAAVTLARAGLSVTVFERNPTIGGGARTSELTLPGFHHDVCSAVHPMALASGFFQRFRLQDRIELVVPEISYAHPLDGGRAGIAYRDLDRTAESLGRDGAAWRSLWAPLVAKADDVAEFTGSNLLRIPPHSVTVARFGLRAIEQGSPLWNARFHNDEAPAMITGLAAHAIAPMPQLAPAAAGLALGTYAHARGWPIPIGGSQSIIEAMAVDFRAHGGEIVTNAEITSLHDLPAARATLFSTTPRALSAIAGDALPDGYRKRLQRFRYGNSVAKVDFALSGPVPWTNPELRRAGTLHVGGTRAEIAQGERDVAEGRHPVSPYVLTAQPSISDSGRAPKGQHVLWTYTHVPNGSTLDATEAITAQIERFAPGFRDLILASASKNAVEMQEFNPNYIGGDIAGGAPTLRQLIARPTLSLDPWRTPARGIYLGSSSAVPGPGVTGLAGWHAAESMLKHEFGLELPDLAP